MKNPLVKVLNFVLEAREEMSEEEFKSFIAANATISLGVMRELEGVEFYEGFVQAAMDEPKNLKIEKGTVQ